MTAAPRFVFGRGLFDLVAGEPAVLADHAWIWTDRDDAVVVAVPGRQVYGVLVEVAGDGGDTCDVTVGGRRVRALVDVAEPDDVDPDAPSATTLAALLAAADRLGLPAVWREHLELWGRATRPPLHHTRTVTLRELLTWPGVREEVELRSRFGFMAIHGGDLEAMTDTIARAAAERSGASYYGVVHPDGCTTHVASTAFDPAESPALLRFVDHIDVVVSVHGYGRRGRWRALLLGGSNRALADEVAAALAPRLPDYECVTDLDQIPRELRGSSRRNPVNLPRHGGVQLELPPRVRGLSPLSPPPGPDGLSPPTAALIDALAAVAQQRDER